MRTFEQIHKAALSRALDLNVRVPGSASLAYRRISVRQQTLFGWVAGINPAYYTIQAIGTLDAGGGIDLRAMLGDGVREAAAVVAVYVESMVAFEPPAEAPYAVGDRIALVPPQDDPTAYLAPRATIRDHAFEPVGADLADVLTIRMHYAYRSDPVADEEDGTSEIAMESPFDELLVIDLTRYLTRKTLKMEAASKTAIINELNEEEKELLASFEAHVRRFLTGQESRQGGSQGHQP